MALSPVLSELANLRDTRAPVPISLSPTVAIVIDVVDATELLGVDGVLFDGDPSEFDDGRLSNRNASGENSIITTL